MNDSHIRFSFPTVHDSTAEVGKSIFEYLIVLKSPTDVTDERW